MVSKKRMPPVWEVPDDLWKRLEPLINELDPPKATGRPRHEPRRLVDALIFRFRTGCPWNHSPQRYGDDATMHRTFHRGQPLGLFAKRWALLIRACEELGPIDWQWQAADTALGKVRWGGDASGPNLTDRANSGTKRSLLTEGGGGPVAVVVAPATVPDTKLLAPTLAALVVERPRPTPPQPQHWCLDKAYANPTGAAAVNQHRYSGHIRRLEEAAPPAHRQPKPPARRWVVERTLAWLSKCRGILVRYEKKAANYLALIQLACALLWYRRLAYSSF